MNIFDDGPYLTPKEVAERLKLKVTTLQALRTRGGGPAFVKLGYNRVRYSLKDIEAWESQRRYNSTGEEKAGLMSQSNTIYLT